MRHSLAALALLCACAPNPAAPTKVMAMLYNVGGKLGPRETQLETITSLTGLKGSVAELVGGASVVLDPNDPAQQNLGALSDQQVQDALYRDRGGDVRGNFIDRAGVYWPGDFHTWNMVTTYWNFEKSFLYFQRIYDGEQTMQLDKARVLYWGTYRNLGIADPERQDLTDNAIYYSPVKAFVLAPFKEAQLVPLPMNLGIIGHEYAHRVFSQKAFGDAALPPQLSWQGASLNLLKGLDEGLADFHGYGVTCNAADGPGCSTTFIAASFDDGSDEAMALVKRRDFSRAARGENCLTVELRTAIANQSTDVFLGQGKQYEVGTLFAASLYQAALKGGKLEIMQKALIKAYSDSTNGTPGYRQLFDSNVANPERITLEALSDVILSHITDPDLKRLACNELWDRLQLELPNTAVTHCPNTSIKGNSCPVLPPP